MKIKESRGKSFAVIFFVYLLASGVGVTVCHFLPTDLLLSVFIADVVATVFVFLFSIIFGNASVYDPYWSVQPIVILTVLTAARGTNLSGALLLVAVCIWGVRLTANWAYTFRGLMHEDWRYVMLKEKTGVFYPAVNFLGIHLFPTLIVYLCTLPAIEVIVARPDFNALSLIFFVLSLFSVVLQGVADLEMHAYRKEKKEPFIRTGLWKYSRHPNYLGEILFWWGVGLYSLVLIPSKWYFILGGLAVTVMFFAVSIPMADKRQSLKEGFADYKKETFALLPVKKPTGK